VNFEIIVAAVVGFIITALSGFFFIPFLKKLKYGQTILEIGPRWHKNKEGTPTMGGLMFILGIVLALICAFVTAIISGGIKEVYSTDNIRLFAGVIMALLFGAIGFVDDYIKVVKKRNLGLTAKQKMAAQILIAVCYLVTLYLGGDKSTELYIPFIGSLDLGIFYYPFSVFVIVGFVNAVNLTDGIDGLAASVTFMASLGFMAISILLRASSMNMLAAALAGGCVGFLMFNFHPAKVFMGDTGSMFLGGLVVALAFGLRQPPLLVFCGIIYLIETGSVMLQVTYFKLTHGKRIFKMSPIHHHYEMSGWSEVKIVIVFSIVTLIGCAVAVLSVVNMIK
jgi:phospho-N-acetylmuramoyl-pentapeptide-transferase